MKSTYPTALLLLLCCLSGFAQTDFYQSDLQMRIESGTFLSINGNVLMEGNSLISNSDSIFLTGDLTNNSQDSVFDKTTDGWLRLTGADQAIGGSRMSNFNHLSLEGSDDKAAETDLNVFRGLWLSDKVLNVDSNTVYVLNPDSSSVQFALGTGYVNSTYTGGLARLTNSTANYFFPLGEPALYRPVVVNPDDADLNVVKVGLIGQSPDLDGFPIDQRDIRLCRIDDQFYHEYQHLFGSSPVNLGIFHDPLTENGINDGSWWENALWNDHDSSYVLAAVLPAPSGTQDLLFMNAFYIDGQMYPVSIGVSSEDLADAGTDDSVNVGQSVAVGGNVNAQQALDGVFFDWNPSIGLDCATCPNPLASPSEETTYELEITTPEGCSFKDSVTIFIRIDPDDPDIPISGSFFCPDIPNFITPAKSTNTNFRIPCLVEGRYPNNNLVIFNRWGDEVFSARSYQNDWNGTWRGKELPEGTYYFVFRFRDEQDNEREVDGPLTILR